GEVIEELAIDAAHGPLPGTGSVARGETPTILPVPCEVHRIPNRVFLLDERRLAAVLEVVRPVLPHEGVADAAKVYPHVRQLMREERSRVEELAIVDALPLIRRRVGAIAFGRQRVRRCSETENVEQQAFVVAL